MAIGLDKKGMVRAADSLNSVYSLRDTGWKWECAIATGNIWEVVFDNNNLILFTDLGIYCREKEMFYGTNKYRNRFSNFARGRFRPSCVFVDINNNIWIGNNSRLGTEIHVFSITQRSFITSKLKGFGWIGHIQNIFGYRNTVFLTDMDINGMSAVLSYKKDTMKRLHHPEYDTMTIGPSKAAEEYIGGAFFDENRKQIFYYSNQGLMKSDYNQKKNKLEIPIKIMAPQYLWNGYEFESIGFVMRLKKMFQHKNLIIYLNHEEGIFLYDGLLLYNLT